MSFSKDYIYGMAHYLIALMRFKSGEYGWVKSHWHFLLAYECMSRTDSAYIRKCANYISLIDEKNRVRELELEESAAEAGICRRIRRYVENNIGDLGDINLALFLTRSDSQMMNLPGRICQIGGRSENRNSNRLIF